jgi:hypothetical protein
VSNNPTCTLIRSFATVAKQVVFCLAVRVRRNEETLICTRVNLHIGHCCDEITGKAWSDHGLLAACPQKYDHSKEKGLRS